MRPPANPVSRISLPIGMHPDGSNLESLKSTVWTDGSRLELGYYDMSIPARLIKVFSNDTGKRVILGLNVVYSQFESPSAGNPNYIPIPMGYYRVYSNIQLDAVVAAHNLGQSTPANFQNVIQNRGVSRRIGEDYFFSMKPNDVLYVLLENTYNYLGSDSAFVAAAYLSQEV